MNLMKIGYNGYAIDEQNLTALDMWILNRLDALIADVNIKYDHFELGEVARSIYNFTWDDFASKYLEMTKVDFSSDSLKQKINTGAILTKVLTTILQLLHPFMPFVTEEIYQHFHTDSIVISKWPTSTEMVFDASTLDYTDKLFAIISAVRNIRSEKNVAMSKKIHLFLETEHQGLTQYLEKHRQYLARFTNYETLEIGASKDKKDAIVVVLDDVNLIIPLKELINLEEEKAKLKLQIAKLEKEVERSSQMLNNPQFVAKAPRQKIETEQNKLESYQEQLKEVQALLKGLEE